LLLVPSSSFNKVIQFHFANILSPWISRGLIAAGFGIEQSKNGDRRRPVEVAPVVPPHHPEVFKSEEEEYAEAVSKAKVGDIESRSISTNSRGAEDKDGEPVKPLISQRTPYFHFDLASAVAAAEATAEAYPSKRI
jgi:sodium-independent sulfate anion transporter 11